MTVSQQKEYFRNQGECILKDIEQLLIFTGNQMDPPILDIKMIKFPENDLIRFLNKHVGIISHAIEYNEDVERNVYRGGEILKYSLKENLNEVVNMLSYNAVMIEKFETEIILDTNDTNKTEEIDKILEQIAPEQLSIHNGLVKGYIYYIQHCMETILFGAQFDKHAFSISIMFYRTLFVYRKHVVASIKQGKTQLSSSGNVSSSQNEFLQQLQKFLGTLPNVIKDRFRGLEGLEGKLLMDGLKRTFTELSNVANDTEKENYLRLFKKLENIKEICKKIVEKRDKLNNTLVDTLKNTALFCSDEVNNCLKNLGLYEITDISPSNTENTVKQLFGSYNIPTNNTIRSLITYVTLVANTLKERKENPSREDCQISKSLTIQNLYNSDKLYYDLVDFYENVSGAVRVYVRTKDIVNNEVVMKFGDIEDNDTKNGIIKNYNSNEIIFEESDIIKTKEDRIHGPFYKVIETGKDNNEIIEEGIIDMKNIVSMFQMVKTTKIKCNIVIFTYGYSGSGKSFTLFGNNKSIDGIWKYMNNKLNNADLTIKYDGCKKVYGYLSKNTFLPLENPTSVSDKKVVSRISSVEGTFQEFLDREIFSTDIKTEEVDAFVKSTPNNSASSRGFLIVTHKIFSGDQELGKIGMIDMAGNEDPYDLMIKLLPTLQWPTASNQNFINNESSLVDIDFTYNALYKLYLQTYITVINITFSLFRYTQRMGKTGINLASKANIEKAVYNFLGSVLKHVGSEYKIDNDTKTFTNIIRNQIAVYVKAHTVTCMKAFLESLKSISIFSTNKYFEHYDSVLKDKYIESIRNGDISYVKEQGINLIKKNFSLINNEFKTQISGTVGTMDVSVAIVESLITDEIIYDSIQKEIDELYDTVVTNNRELFKNVDSLIKGYDLIDFIDYNGSKSDKCKDPLMNPDLYIIDYHSLKFSWRTFDLNDKIDDSNSCIKNRLKKLKNDMGVGFGFCEEKNPINIFNGKIEYDKYRSCIVQKVDDVIYQCMKKQNSKAELIPVLKLASLIKYKYNTLVPQMMNKNSPMEKQYTQEKGFEKLITIDTSQSPILSPGEKTRSLAIPIIMTEKTTVDDILNTVNMLENKLSDYLNIYFESQYREIQIDDTYKKFKLGYLLRIIQEGFFINQANRELVTYLKNKQNTTTLVESPSSKTTSVEPCKLDQKLMYFDTYNKFGDIYDKTNTDCNKTGLTEELDIQFPSNNEEKSKYIMICNLRREKDIKFRLGALDTLKLVAELKST